MTSEDSMDLVDMYDKIENEYDELVLWMISLIFSTVYLL